MFSKLSIGIIAIFTLVFVSSCTQAENNKTLTAKTEMVKPQTAKNILTVYKNPSCGCCKKWISHIEKAGFETKVVNRMNLFSFKVEKGIQPRYRSCHTAVSKNGYIFEGHVPAKYVTKFLAEKPNDAIGLSVPGMPMGAPGMEMGDRFMPYQVLLLKKDGSSEVYAFVQSSKEQY